MKNFYIFSSMLGVLICSTCFFCSSKFVNYYEIDAKDSAYLDSLKLERLKLQRELNRFHEGEFELKE